MTIKELIKRLESDRRNAKKRFLQCSEHKEMCEREHNNYNKKDHEFKEKTYLYIRATDTDNGSRPLSSGTVYWQSPDIELYDSDGKLLTANELKEGKRYAVEVTVNNDGDMSCNSCIVELFICNPSIGFGVQHAKSIGIKNVQVLGHNKTSVKFEFTPGASTVGHHCLFARAYSYTNGDMPDSSSSFSPSTDRHAGQQNLCIIEQGDIFEFQVLPFPGNAGQGKFHLQIIQNLAEASPMINAVKLMGLKPITKQIYGKEFTVFQHKGARLASIGTHVVPQINSLTREVMLNTKKIDAKKFKKIEAVNDNRWSHSFKPGLNKIAINIPYILQEPKRAAIYDIEVTNQNTGQSLGGITLIVKG